MQNDLKEVAFSVRDLGTTGNLDICYCHVISMFCQIYTLSVPEQTANRDFSVSYYSGNTVNRTSP